MSLISPTDWLSMLGSFIAVIGLLLVTLLTLKKMGHQSVGVGVKDINILAVQNLGGRQKLLLVATKTEQILIGVSPQNITRLGNWPLLERSNSVPSGSMPNIQEQATPTSGTKKFSSVFLDILDRGKA